MAESTPLSAEAIACRAVIEAHRMIPGGLYTPATCSGCDWTHEPYSRATAHEEHLARLFAARETAARADGIERITARGPLDGSGA